MDKIFLRELQIDAIIGVLPHERIQPQPVIINLEIATDIRAAAKTETLVDTIDYAAIAQCVTDFVSASKFQLLETLAEKIAELILQKFKVNWLRLEIAKPSALKNAKNVGIIIEREYEKRDKNGVNQTISEPEKMWLK